MVGPTAGSNKHLSSYYESLRSNVMSILGQVKVPPPGSVAACNDMEATASTLGGCFNPSKENFDSYLTKLQTICTETMSNEEVKPHHPAATHHQIHTTQQPSIIDSVNSVSNGSISAIGHGANSLTMPTSI